MTKNSKGVLGQIEGLKESFEGVLRKRTQYRQQINQLTACLRERNRTIRDLKVVNQALNEELEVDVQKMMQLNDLLNEYRRKFESQQCEIRTWRAKTRALAAELHERGGNGETVEDPPEEPLELSQESPTPFILIERPA